MASRLSPKQVQFFKDEGYLLFDQPVLPQPRFDAGETTFGWKYSSTPAERLTISVSRVKMRGSACGSDTL